MPKVSLSDLAVKNLAPPTKGQERYWDAALPGFGIRISQGGAKTWIVLDPRSKTRAQETIGRYPLISLADARAEAKRRLAEATLGKHRPKSVPWDAAVAEFLAEVKATRKPRTHEDYVRLIAKLKFASTRLSEISPHDIRKKLTKLDYAPAEQQHTFVIARAFLNWAVRKHYLDASPMGRMKPPHRYKPRERILTNAELAAVWKACGDDTFSRIVKLLILTGQRRGEIAALMRAMVGSDRITLPASLTKNGREHAIPLLPLAARTIPEGEGLLLGVAVGDASKPYSAWSKAKAALDERSEVSGWTLHDLRRTTASGLAAIGVSLPVIEKLLNHTSGSFAGIVGVYQRHDFFPEMREALEKWEAHLQTLTLDPT